MSKKIAIRFVLAVFSILFVSLGSSPAFAMPMPDFTFYGTIFVNDVPLTAADTDYTVTLEVDGVELVAYTMGDDPQAEDYYVLKVPMDTDPEVPDSAYPEDTAYIYVNGDPVDENPVTIGNYGQTDLLDIHVTIGDCTLTMEVIGNGSTTPPVGDHVYPCGTEVPITATPDADWEFVNWTGDGIADPSSSSTTVLVDTDKTVTATFTQEQCTLTMEVIGNGSTTPPVGPNDYPCGTEVPISATPDAGWEFVNWAGDGIADPASPNTTVLVEIDMTVTAHFSPIMYTLTMAVEGCGSTTPEVGEYPYVVHTVVDISATPDAGWQFDKWTDNVADPSEESTTVTMDGDKTVTAFFAPGKTICSTLGDQPGMHNLDIDTYRFRGTEGETVTIRLDADPPESGLGKQVHFASPPLIKTRSPVTLPYEITMTPSSSHYQYLSIGASGRKEVPGIRCWEKYMGDYCITLEASPETCQTFEATSLVE